LRVGNLFLIGRFKERDSAAALWNPNGMLKIPPMRSSASLMFAMMVAVMLSICSDYARASALSELQERCAALEAARVKGDWVTYSRGHTPAAHKENIVALSALVGFGMMVKMKKDPKINERLDAAMAGVEGYKTGVKIDSMSRDAQAASIPRMLDFLTKEGISRGITAADFAVILPADTKITGGGRSDSTRWSKKGKRRRKPSTSYGSMGSGWSRPRPTTTVAGADRPKKSRTSLRTSRPDSSSPPQRPGPRASRASTRIRSRPGTPR
jgi:hypothetical protein